MMTVWTMHSVAKERGWIAIDEMPMLAPYGTFEWLVLSALCQMDELLAQPGQKRRQFPECDVPVFSWVGVSRLSAR